MSGLKTSEKNNKTYIVPSLWLPELDVLRGKAYNVAMVVDDTSSGTAGADIDSDVMVEVRSELIVRIC